MYGRAEMGVMEGIVIIVGMILFSAVIGGYLYLVLKG